MKVALYTAIYGDSDWVKPVPDLGVPCVLITDRDDRDAEKFGWSVRVERHFIATTRGEPRITAPMLAHKFWKTHPHLAVPDADVTMWVDGSMQIVVDDYVERCLAALDVDDWSCVRHPARSCIYPEADLSATLTWRYDADSIKAQADFYRSIGHPPDWGLIATGANVRRHAPNVIELGELWWQECLNWSHQDQLSLPVLLRLADGKVPFNYNLPWFTWWHLYPHGEKPDE